MISTGTSTTTGTTTGDPTRTVASEGTAAIVHDATVCDRFHRAIELIGRRWSGAILSAMSQGASRFCEIREAVPGISDRLLTERLRELEDEGIVVREVTPTRPPQVSYELTEKGRALHPVLEAVAEWAAEWTETVPSRAAIGR